MLSVFKRDIPRLLSQTILLYLISGIIGRETVSLGTGIVLLLIFYIFTLIVHSFRLRIIPSIILGCLFPLLLMLLARLIFIPLRIIIPATEFYQVIMGNNMILLGVPLLLFTLMNLIVHRYPQAAAIDVLINSLGLFFITFGWNRILEDYTMQRGYLVGVSAGILLMALQGISLFLIPERINRAKGQKTVQNRILSLALLALFMIASLLQLSKWEGELSMGNGGGLLSTGIFRFDFSSFVKLESEITMSNDLVFLYRKEGPADKMYLRRYILNGYSRNKGYFRDRKMLQRDIPESVPNRPYVLDVPYTRHRKKVSQDFFMVNISPTTLLSLPEPEKIIPMISWDKSSFKSVYSVEANISALDIADYKLFMEEYPEMEEPYRSYYTDYGLNRRIKDLAEELTVGLEHPLDKAQAIQDWLHKDFQYTLKPGKSPDGNQLEYFLFETHTGYCSYFAFAMTLMCRSLGIPSRVAVGFWVDPNGEVLNFYPIQANQAHAWVEVYGGDLGWITYDPTTPNLSLDEEWSFEPMRMEGFSGLIQEIIMNEDKLRIRDEMEPMKLRGQWNIRKFIYQAGIKSRRYFFLLPLIYALLIILSRTYFLLRSRLTGNARKSVRFRFLVIFHYLSRAGARFTHKKTMKQWSREIKDIWNIDVSGETDLYLKSVFGESVSKGDLQAMIQLEKEFKIKKKQLPLKNRVRAIIYPFPGIRRPK